MSTRLKALNTKFQLVGQGTCIRPFEKWHEAGLTAELIHLVVSESISSGVRAAEDSLKLLVERSSRLRLIFKQLLELQYLAPTHKAR